ncbi:MAG: GYDIA family GHMP kinase, partial [Bacteroidota bacterium]
MSKETEKYYSHGKFLITGEYLVMAGADALVLPLNKGQYLTATICDSDQLKWESWYAGELWFMASYHPESFQLLEASDNTRGAWISVLLKAASELSKKRKHLKNTLIKTELEFHPEWGMGSSSTLITNISYLFDVSAFDLYARVAKGSAFDIAAALSVFPFKYRLQRKNRQVFPVRLPGLFYDHAFFIYLGEKADSQAAVEDFSLFNRDLKMPVKYISEITGQFTELDSVEEMSRITGEHEAFMIEVLGLDSPLGRFADYPYGMKSLGAWGGDFIMAVHPGSKHDVENYFKHK